MDTDTILRFLPLLAGVIAVILVHQFIIKPKVMKVGGKKSPLEAVRYFRNLGYFADYRALSDEALATKLRELHERQWGIPLDPELPFFDQFLLLWDKKRFWVNTVHLNVAMDTGVYVKVLKEWAAISQGSFEPQDIKETWESPEGPIEVTFTLDGQQHSLHPEFMQTTLDDRISAEINGFTKDSGYYLVNFASLAPNAVIFFTTKKELAKLIGQRRWDFQQVELIMVLEISPRGLGSGD